MSPADSRHAIAACHAPQPSHTVGMALGDVMEHDADAPPLPGDGRHPLARRGTTGRTRPRPRWPRRSRPPAPPRAHSPWRTPAARLRSSIVHEPGGEPSAAARTRQPLQQGVHGGRHPVERAQQHDLAVEELGLDRPGTAGEALPAGAPLPLARTRRRELEGVAAPGAILLGAGHVDARRGEDVLPLALGLAGQWAEPVLGAAERLDRVGQVHEELAVLPAHDVGARHRLERRGVDGVRDGLARGIDAGGEASEVEQARDGRRMQPGPPPDGAGWPGT